MFRSELENSSESVRLCDNTSLYQDHANQVRIILKKIPKITNSVNKDDVNNYVTLEWSALRAMTGSNA